MAVQTNTVDETVARIAGGQHGLATRAQLLLAGVTRHQIARRLERGSLFRVHRGVYRVGHRAASVEARYLAAVLAAGDGALLAGRAAAHLLGLTKETAPAPELVTTRQCRPLGVKIHRARHIDRRDRTLCRGIPTTTVPRTLADLAADTSSDDLARACHEAGLRYGTTPAQVERVLARRPNSPGAAMLRRILHGDVHVTLSRLEARFLELVEQDGLPLPQTNRPAGGFRVDCRWPKHRLTVELDSYRYHNSRHSWERDLRREREARARGDDFCRYTWADVFGDPRPMLAELSALPIVTA